MATWEPRMLDLWDRFSLEEKQLMAKCIPSGSIGAIPFMSFSKMMGAIGGKRPDGSFNKDYLYQLYHKFMKLHIYQEDIRRYQEDIRQTYGGST